MSTHTLNSVVLSALMFGKCLGEGLTFSHMCQLREELVEFLLAICQLATATVVDAEAIHNAVDDEETVLVCGERL